MIGQLNLSALRILERLNNKRVVTEDSELQKRWATVHQGVLVLK
jgi:hypothetical protein